VPEVSALCLGGLPVLPAGATVGAAGVAWARVRVGGGVGVGATAIC
jgi:hypothetical protein